MKRSAKCDFISMSVRSPGLLCGVAQIDRKFDADAFGDIVGSAILGVALLRHRRIKKGRSRDVVGGERRQIAAFHGGRALPREQIRMWGRGGIVKGGGRGG